MVRVSFQSPFRHVFRSPVAVFALIVFVPSSPAAPLPKEDYRRAAQAALEKYRFAEALKSFEQCVKLEPKSAELHLLAAQAARRGGEYEKAEKYLKEAERLKAEAKAVQLERWMLQMQMGEMDEAETPLWKHLASKHPQSSLILEAMTIGYANSFRFGTALWAAKRLLEKEPKNVPGRLMRAWILVRNSNFPEAEEDYRRVLEIDPDLDSAKLSLANVLYQTSRAPDAVKLFEEVAKRRPEDPAVLLGLARCQEELGKADEARKLLEKLIAKHPKHVEGLTQRGKLAFQEGKGDEAEKWLRRAVKSDPHNRLAMYTLYLCLNQQGKEKEAQQLLPKLQKIEEGIERLMEITVKEMDAKPRDAGLHHEIGAILLRSGQEQTGILWLKRTLKLDPKHRPTHKLLADYYEKTGDKQRAAEHRKLAEPG